MIGVRESTPFRGRSLATPVGARRGRDQADRTLGVLVAAIVFVWAGIKFTGFGWYRISELAELPLWTIHIAWPIAGATCSIFLGEQMYDDVRIVIRKAA